MLYGEVASHKLGGHKGASCMARLPRVVSFDWLSRGELDEEYYCVPTHWAVFLVTQRVVGEEGGNEEALLSVVWAGGMVRVVRFDGDSLLGFGLASESGHPRLGSLVARHRCCGNRVLGDGRRRVD